MAAHIDEKLHVGVPEEGGLALGARLVLHFDKICKISQLSESTSRIFVFLAFVLIPSALKFVDTLNDIQSR